VRRCVGRLADLRPDTSRSNGVAPDDRRRVGVGAAGRVDADAEADAGGGTVHPRAGGVLAAGFRVVDPLVNTRVVLAFVERLAPRAAVPDARMSAGLT